MHCPNIKGMITICSEVFIFCNSYHSISCKAQNFCICVVSSYDLVPFSRIHSCVFYIIIRLQTVDIS
nr:MAG TPA: hypothetical protein [Caudoviricetes sp.]